MKPPGCRKTRSSHVGAFEDAKMGKAREREVVRREVLFSKTLPADASAEEILDCFMEMKSEVKPTPTEPTECDHGVTFDDDAARGLDSHEVRRRWPRLMGTCPKGCGYNGIAYASFAHYISGDW